MHYDLIIIGMGLSGLMAAKTAAEAGRRVLIVGKGMGSLCLFANTIDLLGRCPAGTKMKDGLFRWISDHPDHPYAKVGLAKIEESIASFVSLFTPPYSFQAIDQMNSFIPTGAGTLRPTYLVPATMTEAASLEEKSTLLVGFEGFKDFYPHSVADRLRCRGISLPPPDSSSRERTATALARLMEQRSFRENVGKEIKKRLQGETRIGFPAVLGINDPIRVKEDLEEITGTKVFEVPILPPSVPGRRIFNRFKEWLIKKGVTFLMGYPVVRTTVTEKRCRSIEVLRPPVISSFVSDRFILATGRFMGGGLKADAERVFETIFNLPIHQPPSREGWFENRFFSDLPHTIHRAGVLASDSLQPADERGNAILENVWIAGTLLAHHQCIDEKSREGIEIATGYTAAKRALGT